VLTSRRTVFIFYFLFSVFALSFFTGCGAPGEPAERKSPIPVAVTDLAASQQGNDVILTFTLPKESIERKPLKHLPAVEIYRAFAPASTSPTPSSPLVRTSAADLLVTIPSEMVDHIANRNQFRYVDTLSAESFLQNPGSNAVYFIRTRTSSKKVSADSNFASLAVEPAPDPVSDLKTEMTRDAIVLTWTPHIESIVQKPMRINRIPPQQRPQPAQRPSSRCLRTSPISPDRLSAIRKFNSARSTCIPCAA
jgi:hypothetical protein